MEELFVKPGLPSDTVPSDPPPAWLTVTVCGVGFAPFSVTSNVSVSGVSTIAEATVTVSVTLMVSGPTAGSVDETMTDAEYVPAPRLATVGATVTNAGACVRLRAVLSQPVGPP